MRDVEDRIGVGHIEERMAERALLVDEVADLRAVHGSFGTFDPQRKVQLSQARMLLRAQYTRDKIPFTEAKLDEDAHSYPDYVDFITQATLDRAELARKEAEIYALDAIVRRENGLVHFCANEARL